MPLRPSSNTGANSLCRVRHETSRMDPAELGKPTKGERHKTPSRFDYAELVEQIQKEIAAQESA